MRILHVINRLGTSGTETSLRELLPALQGDGFHNAVATFFPGDAPTGPLAETDVEVFPPESVLSSRRARIRHVLAAIDRFRPDLIHTALFEADLAGRVAGLLTRTPVLTSLVNTSYAPAAWPDDQLSRIKFRGVKVVDGFLGRHCTYAFHAVTQAVADACVADLRLDPSRVTVVPRGRSLARLGTPSDRRRRALRRELDIPMDAPVLLNVGRHEPQKGQLDLIASLPTVQQQHPDVQVVIAGREGRSTSALRQRIQAAGLHRTVHLLGSRDDIGDLLCAADVFVFPSRYEGIGGAVLEAMVMGVPVVASDIPGLREVLDDGRCGLLVPVGDVAALAHAVSRTLSNSDEAGGRARAAQHRTCDVYSFEAYVEGMRSLYRHLHAGLNGGVGHD